MRGVSRFVASRLVARPDPRSITHRIRRRRFERFLRELEVKPHDRILDVGGSPYFWRGSGLEAKVTILNTRLPEVQEAPFQWVYGDACAMTEFDDLVFDVVFSNSVIEHVGGSQRQSAMAAEVRRVGKRYWVQTPYKHFPVEPHFLFPAFQYFPRPIKVFISRIWPFSYARIHGLDPLEDIRDIRLLNRRELQALFPDADVLVERLGGLVKSLIAVRR